MMLSLIIIFFTAHCGGGLGAPDLFVRPSSTISAEALCSIFSDFTPEQRNFCIKYPLVTGTIAAGIKNGIQECEKQFEHHRWNCISTKDEMSFGQNRAVAGTKEAAFLNAIVAAGVAHSVTAACAKDIIKDCNCASKSKYERDGCTANDIRHGIGISKTFLVGGPIRKNVDLQLRHNREAGRQAILKNVNYKCNCHGVSGACTSKTCWETLSTTSFERVGSYLRNEYQNIILVATEASETRIGKIPIVLVLPGTKFVKPPKEKLVYLKKSPTYCDAISEEGVAGTRGRVCDHLSKQSDGCNALCCGRGYNKIVLSTVKQCKCQFTWCCEVKCKTCKIKKEQTVCK